MIDLAEKLLGNTAQLCLRAAAVLLPHIFSLKNEKYCAAVASVSWLTDAAYPLRVHTVFLRFPNFELSQKSRLGLLAKLCGVALKASFSVLCFHFLRLT